MENRIVNRNWTDMWNLVRSLSNPIESFNVKSEDAGVIVITHKVPKAVDSLDGIETVMIEHPNISLQFSCFLELIMREVLVSGFISDGAASELQSESYDDILLILLHGARKGALNDFHGGLSTLEDIEEWSKTTPTTKAEAVEKINELSKILEKADLDISITYK